MEDLDLEGLSDLGFREGSPPKMERRITTENEQKLQKSCDGGIDHSNGKTWFRGRLIGRGGQGSVYLAHKIMDGSPFPMAVKSAPMARSSPLQSEKTTLSVLEGGSNLVRCYGDEIIKTESGDEIYNLLIEYCSGGSLADRIIQSKKGLPDEEVASFAVDILRGLEYMHSRGYAHCDIKPENILLVPKTSSLSRKVNYEAKIADFGLALRMVDGEDSRFGIRGTLRYMAPEMVRDATIDFPVDIWSFGCTVLEMLTGKPAWGGELMKKNKKSAMEYIGHSFESPKIPDNISEMATYFLEKCLDLEPGFYRWPASRLLRHPFLSQAIVGRSSRL